MQERFWPWRTLFFLALVFVVSNVFLRFYHIEFNYPRFIVLLGSVLATLPFAVFCLTIALISPYIAASNRKRAARQLAMVLTLLLSGVIFVYGVSYASSLLWGSTIDWQVALGFVLHPTTLLGFFPASSTFMQAAIGALIAGLISIAAVFYWLSLFISTALLLEAVNARAAAKLLFFGLRPLEFGLTMLICTGIGFSIYKVNERSGWLHGEPITTFFRLLKHSDLAALSNARLTLAKADEAARVNYRVPSHFEKKNVIVIFSDSLRADRTSLYGYSRPTTPFLESLYAKGQLHKVAMALSTCSESYCGIATTFASRPYHELSTRNFKLFEVLKLAGYQTHFYLAGDHERLGDIRQFYGDGADRKFALSGPDINNDQLLIDKLTELEPSGGNQNFFYFFLMTTHVLGNRQPAFEKWQPSNINAEGVTSFFKRLKREASINARASETIAKANDWPALELEAIRNRYDNGVVQSDHLISKIFEILQAKGYLQNSLVVILGDHGDGLGEHNHTMHGRYLFQEDIHIPLLVYDSQPTRYQNAAFATQIDIAPTILDRLGLPVPATWQGRSLVLPAPATRTTVHQTWRTRPACYATVEYTSTSLWKLKRCVYASGPEDTFLFNLISDPGEITNLSSDTQHLAKKTQLHQVLIDRLGHKP